MPWLRLIFEAWEDYKQTREREAHDFATQEAALIDATAAEEDVDAHRNHDDDDDHHGHKRKKKKKKHRK